MTQPPRPRRASVLVGMFRVARGRPDGLQFFGNTRQAFLTSLAPMGGLLLAGLIEGLASGDGFSALAELLPLLCALLAPPVLSYELARLWQREAEWLRFATAVNWCQLMLPFVGMAILLVLGVAKAAGLSAQAADALFAICLGGYALWLHWFVARNGLAISGRRAALLVAGVNLGTALMVFGPRLLVTGRE
jgi:hypothetical protein